MKERERERERFPPTQPNQIDNGTKKNKTKQTQYKKDDQLVKSIKKKLKSKNKSKK